MSTLVRDDRARKEGSDTGAWTEEGSVDTGTGLAIGGDQTLRGVKAYTLLGATATVAAPYGLTQVNAAKAFANVNGVVRFPAAGSPYAFATTMDIAGQTWQMETAATQIRGFNVTATGCTFEGGIVDSDIALPVTGNGHNFTLRNVTRQGGFRGILNESRSGMWVKNCEFYGQSGAFSHTFYNNAQASNVDGQLWENCIGIRSAGSLASTIVGHNEDGQPPTAHTMKNFRVTNCYIDGGTNAQGWFGVEVWGNRANTQGIGATIEYSEIKGGRALLSLVGQSQNNWIHHNILDLSIAYSASETGGSLSTGWIYEYNIVNGTGGVSGTRRGWFAYHNTGSHNHIIRNNKVTGLEYVVGGFPDGGGGYAVTDNCLVNTGVIIPGSFGIANSQSNNGTNGCGF